MNAPMLLADWINLEFPWWFGPLVVAQQTLDAAFWPVTIATVAAIVLERRLRTRGWRIAEIALVLLWALSGLAKMAPVIDSAVSAAGERARQYTLKQSATVAGMNLPAGTVVTRSADDPNGVDALDLPVPAVIGGIAVVGRAYPSNGKVSGDFTLARDTTLSGIPCAGNAAANLDGNGDLRSCVLAHPTVVHGVPCKGKISVDAGVACTLSSDYAYRGYAWRAGTDANVYGDTSDFVVGPNPPSMTVAGLPLPPAAHVNFVGKELWIDFPDGALRYRDCDVTRISLVAGSFQAQCKGAQARTVPMPIGSAHPKP